MYPPAAPPSALPRVELMISTLPLKPRYSSVPLRGREREREREREARRRTGIYVLSEYTVEL